MIDSKKGFRYKSTTRQWIATVALGSILPAIQTAAVAQSWPKGVRQVTVSQGGWECPIRITDPYGGDFTSTRYALSDLSSQKTKIGEFSISFVCLSSDDTDSIRDYTVARYEETNGHWEPDFSGMSKRDQKLLTPVTRWLPLKTINSSGFGTLQDMTTGETKIRSRSLGFCLLHPPVALCGLVPVVAMPYYSRTGVMPYALKIINSIEFLEASVGGKAATPPDLAPSSNSSPATYRKPITDEPK